MIDTAQAFGVDIGGSGIKAAPVDLNKGEFAEPRLKILTPSESTPQAIGSVLRKQLEHFEIPETAPVGISFPAPVKPGQKLNWIANLDQSWVGVDITEALSEECGRPVTVVNDADAAGLAEQQFGAAKGQEGLVVVTTLGTGIGTALIYDGVLIPNTELGHIELEGGKGDAERYASSAVRERKELSYKKWAKASDQVLQPDRKVLQPLADRHRWWREPQERQLRAVYRHRYADRPREAAQRGRHHRCRLLRQHQVAQRAQAHTFARHTLADHRPGNAGRMVAVG